MGKAQGLYTCTAHNLQLPVRTTCPECARLARARLHMSGHCHIEEYQRAQLRAAAKPIDLRFTMKKNHAPEPPKASDSTGMQIPDVSCEQEPRRKLPTLTAGEGLRDVHRENASRMLGIPYEQVTDGQRQQAKNVWPNARSFGMREKPGVTTMQVRDAIEAARDGRTVIYFVHNAAAQDYVCELIVKLTGGHALLPGGSSAAFPNGRLIVRPYGTVESRLRSVRGLNRPLVIVDHACEQMAW